MIGNLLLRGMLAGLLAGVLAFGFAKVFGEPQVDRAIAFEESGHHHHGDDASAGEEEEELVSRQVQSTFGLFTGVVAYGVAVGGIFALVFAFSMGRLGRFKVGPRGLAAILALLGFVAVVLVPGLKYPANPPAVGDPDTIRQRTAVFFMMLVVSIAAMVLAINLAKKLYARHSGWSAAIGGIVAYVVIVSVIASLFPSINEVPDHFSAMLLWNFRIASLGIHATLWTVLGLAFGWLAERRLAAPHVRHEARLRS